MSEIERQVLEYIKDGNGWASDIALLMAINDPEDGANTPDQKQVTEAIHALRREGKVVCVDRRWVPTQEQR